MFFYVVVFLFEKNFIHESKSQKTKQNRKQNDRSHYDDNDITNDFECDD